MPIKSILAILLCIVSLNGFAKQDWQGVIKNKEDVTMMCQAIDYTHFHTYGGCSPCAYAEGKAQQGGNLKLTIGGSNCPDRDRMGNECPKTDVNNIGVDCFADNNHGFVLKLRIPSYSVMKWNFGKFSQ